MNDRKELAWRKRRILYNDDADEISRFDAPWTEQKFLESVIGVVENSQVDTLIWDIGEAGHSHFNTDAPGWAPFGDEIERFEWSRNWRIKETLRALFDAGVDPPASLLGAARAKGMEFFATIRVNDTHDSFLPNYHCQWKRNNPDKLIGRKPEPYVFDRAGASWSGLDFAHPQCREFLFNFISDVCHRYDLDGLDLDFFRHPCTFKPGEEAKHVHVMNDYLRSIRSMIDQVGDARSRPLLLATRVADSPELSLRVRPKT